MKESQDQVFVYEKDYFCVLCNFHSNAALLKGGKHAAALFILTKAAGNAA